MKKVILVLTCFLIHAGVFTERIFAESRTYELFVELSAADQPKGLGFGLCFVKQELDQKNPVSHWSCQFNDREEFEPIKIVADEMGYSEQALFVTFKLSNESPLARYLLEGFEQGGMILEGEGNYQSIFLGDKAIVTPQVTLWDAQKQRAVIFRFDFAAYLDRQ